MLDLLIESFVFAHAAAFTLYFSVGAASTLFYMQRDKSITKEQLELIYSYNQIIKLNINLIVGITLIGFLINTLIKFNRKRHLQLHKKLLVSPN